VLRWSVEALLKAGAEDVAVVVSDGSEAEARGAGGPDRLALVTGGATRAASVRAGLPAWAARRPPVLIHDAARPFLGEAVIHRLFAALETADGALPALPVADSLRRAATAISGAVERDGLWRAQTPRPSAAITGAAYAAWPERDPPPTIAPWSNAPAAASASSRATRG
jgi:2-C-methyl-D-erythritol 4-phosphate cytidylyltransferase/2-C-methyl-D-erythritol 2,4-cyclodiphosphate synthase